MGAREAGGEESGGDREDEEGVSAVWFVVCGGPFPCWGHDGLPL